MTPTRKVKSKKQSAGYRRSVKAQKFKTKRFCIRLKKLKIKSRKMKRIASLGGPKKDFSYKKVHPIEKKSEIRIIKAVSNATKHISKETEKNKSNINMAKGKPNELLLESSNIKIINSKIKSTQLQNIKQQQKLVKKSSPEIIKNPKKIETNITEKPTFKKQPEKKEIEETPLRSKRTPKPNRKYLNDNLITFKSTKQLRKINSDISETESEGNQLNTSSSDVDSDILKESEDSSAEDDMYQISPKSKSKMNTTSINKKTTSIVQTSKLKLSEVGTEKSKPNQLGKLNQNIKSMPTVKLVSLPSKTIILNKLPYQAPNNQLLSQKKQQNEPSKTIIERSQKGKQSQFSKVNEIIARKRKLNEAAQQKELIKVPKLSEKPFLKDNFDSDIEMNDDDDDINNTDIEDFIKELTARKQIKVVKKLSKINKKSVSPAIRTTISTPKKPMILNKSIQQSKEKSKGDDENKKENILQTTQTKIILNKNYEAEVDSTESIADSNKDMQEKDEDPFEKTTSSTLEDFEKMPTFTIVNINDIIGKKGDFMLEKMNKDPLKSASARASPNSIIENVPSSKKKTGSAAGQKSRRKAVHTNLLSENFDKNKDPPPRTPFPPQRKSNNIRKNQSLSNTTPQRNQSNIKILNNSLKLSKSVSSSKKGNLTLSNKSQNKGPPRILNSMVAKKTTPITTFSTKVDTRHSNDMSDSDNEKPTQISPTKENILKNQLLKQMNENKQDNKIQSPTKRKLPSEKVIIQRQGNKIIKKITCFETWYVINLPPETSEKENATRNVVDIPLIHLANQANTIDLPNSKWTCKVSLQKCTAAMMSQNSEPYTGEIYDDYINPDELHKYRPSNVMFRRQALHPTPKVPYDRAVIFKNNTFFTNIEGKNVRLIGAPHQIDKVKDVEILLNLIDDFSLKNQFVEQAPYVP